MQNFMVYESTVNDNFIAGVLKSRALPATSRNIQIIKSLLLVRIAIDTVDEAKTAGLLDEEEINE